MKSYILPQFWFCSLRKIVDTVGHQVSHTAYYFFQRIVETLELEYAAHLDKKKEKRYKIQN